MLLLRRAPAALPHEARPCRLAQEDRKARRPFGATDSPYGRIAGCDQYAPPRIDRVREEVAEAAVLSGRDAGGPALADEVRVDRPAGRVDDVADRMPACGVEDR